MGRFVRLNLDARKYGTFAEIGAGQEVSNWFFRAGAANGTVAKTISAYGMAMSDALYGRGVRYVSRERLQAMLDHEFEILCERLDAERGAGSGHDFLFLLRHGASQKLRRFA